MSLRRAAQSTGNGNRGQRNAAKIARQVKAQQKKATRIARKSSKRKTS